MQTVKARRNTEHERQRLVQTTLPEKTATQKPSALKQKQRKFLFTPPFAVIILGFRDRNMGRKCA